jgi:putative phosphoribosyl transferase
MLLFEDRKDAAKQLAKRLEEEGLKRDLAITSKVQEEEEQELQKYGNNIIVLAIPRGGVIIGDIIASTLNAKLDIIVSRKIGAPDNPELAIGAVMPDGSYFLNQDIVNMLNVPQSYIVELVNIQKKEIQRRLMSFRGSKEVSVDVDDGHDNNDNFEGMTVILVDDGIATGATILSAAQWLKTKQNCCKMLIVAVPVAPPPRTTSSNESIASKLNQIADKVIILYTPEPFYSVGQFYENFEQISDNEVREIMKRHGYNITL